jgi:diguanylate cyclase (GGDEF)-like protein/PAS domain S-box-containing protein
MVGPNTINQLKQPITRQAAFRLFISLSLFVVLLGLATAHLYRQALDKAAQARTNDLAQFYQVRIAELEQQWALHSRDFRVRTEYSRILEDADTATLRLQAFITVQGGERRFQYLLIQKKNGDPVFSFGEGLALRDIPIASGAEHGYYRDPRSNAFYEVFEEPVWLGKTTGMGRMAFFYPIDNALLHALATPETTLTVLHRGSPIASSAGQRGIDAVLSGKPTSREAERRIIPWQAGAESNLQMIIEAPFAPLFSMLEMAVGVSLVPFVDALILWFTLGTWLMLQARRIKHLGAAVEEFSTQQVCTPRLYEKISKASHNISDEIHYVAEAFKTAAEQTVAREGLLASEVGHRRLWSSVFQGSGEAIIITDPEAIILDVNPAFEAIFGYAQEDVRGKNPRTLSSRRETPAFYQAMWQTLHREGFWQGELWNTHMDGSEHPKLVSISSVRDAAGTLCNFVGYYTDISERKRVEVELERYRQNLEELVHARTQALEQANVELERLATTDPLTGLFNRRTLMERGEQCQQNAQRYGTVYSLIIIDIDNFKLINDRFGHDRGDQVLKAVVHKIQAGLRETDTLARWGGEEFIVLSPQSTCEGAILLAERLRQRLAESTLEGAGQVTASFGVAGYVAGDDLDTLIKRADSGLYAAKHSGRNRICSVES